MDILIADDSSTMRQMILRALRQQQVPVSHVREVGDGANALNEVSRHAPDLLITDITMPILDGLKLVREVRRTHGRSTLRIIVVTSKTTQVICSALSAMSVDAIVAKPFTPEGLADAVKRVMGQAQSGVA
jgi:DNA-binding response OmpR family regulator